MRTNRSIWIAALAPLAFAACGGNVSVAGSGGQGTTTVTSTSSSTSTSTSTSTGSFCGGFAGVACPPGDYCDFPAKTCGNGDEPGSCLPLPQGCTDIYEPVCGCDGVVYPNPCSAQQGGVDVNDLGGCTPPTGMFPCGSGFCDIASQYCQDTGSDVANQPGTYECLPLPSPCGATPSCACLTQVMCGDVCVPMDGGLTVHCLAG